MKQIFEIVSVGAAFVSAMTLYYGSLGIPDEEKTWKGQTPRELATKRRQKVMAWIGLPCAVLAFVSQLVVILKYSN
jgi:hypothetical protein